MVRTPSIIMPSMEGLAFAHRRWEGRKLLCFCLSVTLLNGRVCNFATKSFECGSAFNFVSAPLGGINTMLKLQVRSNSDFWPLNGDTTRDWRCFTKHDPHAGRRKGRKCRFCPWWPWPLTLTFKLIRARNQTCLPCEFGANSFSGSRDISHTNKKSQTAPKNRTLSNSLRAV